jgi:hypothetical protein
VEEFSAVVTILFLFMDLGVGESNAVGPIVVSEALTIGFGEGLLLVPDLSVILHEHPAKINSTRIKIRINFFIIIFMGVFPLILV